MRKLKCGCVCGSNPKRCFLSQILWDRLLLEDITRAGENYNPLIYEKVSKEIEKHYSENKI